MPKPKWERTISLTKCKVWSEKDLSNSTLIFSQVGSLTMVVFEFLSEWVRWKQEGNPWGRWKCRPKGLPVGDIAQPLSLSSSCLTCTVPLLMTSSLGGKHSWFLDWWPGTHKCHISYANWSIWHHVTSKFLLHQNSKNSKQDNGVSSN